MKTLPRIMIVLGVLALAGCAGFGPATVAPTVDVTGRWTGTWVATNPSLGSGQIEMTLTQTGSDYTGRVLVTGAPTDPTGPTQGIVSGNQVRVMRPTNLTGSLTVQGDRMTGVLQGVIAANVNLTRQK